MLAGWITTSNSSSGGASWRESMGRGEEIRREFCGWDFNTQGKVLLKLVYKCKLVIAESARLTTLFKFALAGSGQQYVECGAEIGYGHNRVGLFNRGSIRLLSITINVNTLFIRYRSIILLEGYNSVKSLLLLNNRS